jgi:riboflavin kinase/FMN adenylyltransferase
VVIQGARVSSTAIRNAIGGGDMDAASSMLGRPWAIEGEVVRGFQRGREFGFPTANVALGDYARPRLGVYAVRLRLAGAEFDGVANVGVNPTVGALATPVLETHVFDFSEPIYGQVVEVALVSFLRDEAKFDGVDALKAQMAKDCDAARAALSAAGI